jgi:hypothetical protein
LRFKYKRDAHDFSLGPYLTLAVPENGGRLDDQPEAWVMNNGIHPPGMLSDAYLVLGDPSMKNIISSYKYDVLRQEYLFHTPELADIPIKYYNSLVQPIWLPVMILLHLGESPLDALQKSDPLHSALLIKVDPVPGEPASSYGTYYSKWGEDAGIFEHRWGIGHCPPSYVRISWPLRIYAPACCYPAVPPPYWVNPTPWGGQWDWEEDIEQ